MQPNIELKVRWDKHLVTVFMHLSVNKVALIFDHLCHSKKFD